MNKTERAIYIKSIVGTIEESVSHYDAAGPYPMPGSTISMYDSKASIIRRCVVARQELLTLMKELEGNA